MTTLIQTKYTSKFWLRWIRGRSSCFVAMVYITFDSVEAFQTSFGPDAEKLVADILNYTNAQAILFHLFVP